LKLINESISFSDFNFNDQDYVIYDSLFWKKAIINDANNESDLLLRVKDEKGNVIYTSLWYVLTRLSAVLENQLYYTV
jgi:hypothetical protein